MCIYLNVAKDFSDALGDAIVKTGLFLEKNSMKTICFLDLKRH